MNKAGTSGFGNFVPGFDFLQNLAKGAGDTLSNMPGLGSWVAPTLNAEELDKRISELKNVQFWLEQNARALSATIQALEVQKMTLATLKSMNFNIADMANAFRPAAPSGAAGATPEARPGAAAQAAAKPPEPVEEVDDAQADEAPPADEPPERAKAGAKGDVKGKKSATPSATVDPMQLWGALAQQFQRIAATAVSQASAVAASAKEHAAPAPASARAATASPVARKSSAKRAAPRKAAGAKVAATAARKSSARAVPKAAARR